MRMEFILKNKLVIVLIFIIIGLLLLFSMAYRKTLSYKKEISEINQSHLRETADLDIKYQSQISLLKTNREIINETKTEEPNKIVTVRQIIREEKEQISHKQSGKIMREISRQDEMKEETKRKESLDIYEKPTWSIGVYTDYSQIKSGQNFVSQFSVGHRLIGNFWIDGTFGTDFREVNNYQLGLKFEF